MEPDRAALAGLADDVGRALIRYAGRLRSPSVAGSVEAQDGAPSTIPATSAVSSPPVADPAASASGALTKVPDQVDVRLRGLGVSQKKVLEAVLAAGETGTTAIQVAKATGLTSTNTPRMLKTLAERGLISSWGSNPIVWLAQA